MKAQKQKNPAVSILKIIFIWIVIPIGLYFAGFKIFGSMIGAMPEIINKVDQNPQQTPSSPSSPTDKVRQATDVTEDNASQDSQIDPSKAPELDVSVTRSDGRDSKSTSKRSSTKKKKKSEPRSESRSPRDDASADGAMGGDEPPQDPAGGG